VALALSLAAFLRLQEKNPTPASASRISGIATPAAIAAAFDFFFGCSSSAFAGAEVEALAAAGRDVVVAAAADVNDDDEEMIVDVRVKASEMTVMVE
jgi:hypothetical protein